MDYCRIYKSLIDRANDRIIVGYKESHHIVPKCLGGLDVEENLVYLTAEEHYVAHLLLVKIYPDNKSLIYAAKMMTVSGKNLIRNNKLYGWLKKKFSKSISDSQTGSGNSQFGRYWICNSKTGEVLRINSIDEIPIGWNRGKVRNTVCEICKEDTGTKQRRFCVEHRPTYTGRKSTMSKGSVGAIKLSEYCKRRSKEDHPQYGKRWINNKIEQRMVDSSELEFYFELGWSKGKLVN